MAAFHAGTVTRRLKCQARFVRRCVDGTRGTRATLTRDTQEFSSHLSLVRAKYIKAVDIM